MYVCPNCGGNLRFSPTAQQLECTHCTSLFDPYSVTKEKDAEENNEYEVTVFTCPQCAGEIYSTDNTAAGFCSFCGASTILDSRISKEKRPAFIIPFKKTKEDCKREYTKRIRKAVFAPNELRDPKHIEGFRGIYMPYWVYYITQKGRITLKGTTEHRSGDYIITEHYDLAGDLDAYYKGLSYDASSSFADNISERIAPFDVKNMQSFTPSILSGFYADTADVGKQIYEEDAKQIAARQTKQYLQGHSKIKKYSLSDSNNSPSVYNTRTEQADMAMFPVWFMSYRNKDRVAYATVNGQTGKVVADLPVDIRKYLFGSLILAIPIYILLNLFLTMKPAVLLNLVAIISLIAIILYMVEMKQIARKEANLDDKGKMSKGWTKESDDKSEIELEAAAAQENNKSGEKKKQKDSKVGKIVFGIVMVSAVLPAFLTVMAVMFSSVGQWIWAFAMLIAAMIFGGLSYKEFKKFEKKKKLPGIMGALAGIALAVLILFINPVSDLWYYMGVIVSLVAVFFTLYDLICYYNVLATRKLPQFDYKGGDDRAY